MVRLFGSVPLLTNTLSQDQFQEVTQASTSAIYDQIEQDLEDAINSASLPQSLSPDEYGRATKGAANALLGKMLLFRNDNSKMIDAADALKAVINSTFYFLEANFEDNFKLENEFGSESVFEINFSPNAKRGWDAFENGSEGNYVVQFCGMRDYSGDSYSAGWSFLPITEDLVSFMQGDPRFEHTIIDGVALKAGGASYGEGYQNTDYFLRKYAPLQEYQATEGEVALNWSNNHREIRYSDVLLMAAEAIIRSGGSDSEARGYLNQVRSRVGLQPATASGQSLLDAIYIERRKELATEGHRFFDLVRTNQAADALPGFMVGKNELLPIPQIEIDLTNNRFKQNPGY